MKALLPLPAAGLRRTQISSVLPPCGPPEESEPREPSTQRAALQTRHRDALPRARRGR